MTLYETIKAWPGPFHVLGGRKRITKHNRQGLNFKLQAPNKKWFDKLTTLSGVEG
jgi:hypothetical protein